MVSKIEKWMSIIDKEEAKKLVPLQRDYQQGRRYWRSRCQGRGSSR